MRIKKLLITASILIPVLVIAVYFLHKESSSPSSKDILKKTYAGYKHYSVEHCGFKYNMTDIQAAIGLHQLKRIETYHRRRREIWEHYMQGLADLPLSLPAAPDPTTRHAYHLFTVLVDQPRVVHAAGHERRDQGRQATSDNKPAT